MSKLAVFFDSLLFQLLLLKALNVFTCNRVVSGYQYF